MKASLLYKITSILLVLFSAGHTLGFRNVDARWGIDSIVASMQAVHFDAQGFNRTYWDFYVGFGLLVSVFLLFAAILAWQLSAGNFGTDHPAHVVFCILICRDNLFELEVFLCGARHFLRGDHLVLATGSVACSKAELAK